MTEGRAEAPRITHAKYLKIQIATIEELLAGKNPDLPFADSAQFAKAEAESKQQGKLL